MSGWMEALVELMVELMHHPRVHVHRGGDKWCPTANTLCPTIEKHCSYVAVTLKIKRKSTTPREFPGYW